MLGFEDSYFVVTPSGISQFETMVAYLGGSAFQTIGDNPVTAYRQLVQQYAKDAAGNPVDPKISSQEAKAVFKKAPLGASLSGLGPRLVGVLFKRIPKFGILLAISFALGQDGEIGMVAATGASIGSAFFINPIRMIEKQQRAFFKDTGKAKPISEILVECKAKQFRPLFRGTIPLMGHSFASAALGLAGQPKLKNWVAKELKQYGTVPGPVVGLVASAVVSPIYVAVTNPISRLEVIMQTSSIEGKSISPIAACKEMGKDMSTFGLRGVFRGQGIGIAKAVLSLTMFHEGRIFLMDQFKARNNANGHTPTKEEWAAKNKK